MKRKFQPLTSAALAALVLAGAALACTLWAGSASAAIGLTLTGNAAHQLLLDPDEPLFTEENMAPGHSATAVVTAKNEGSKKFNLTVSASKIDGSDLLFEGLQVQIAGPGGAPLYYSGAMNGINAIPIGSIPAQGAMDLVFTVCFPCSAENEYQAASLKMNWIFNATWEETGGGGGGGDDEGYEEEEYSYHYPESPGGREEQGLVVYPERPGLTPGMPQTGVEGPALYYLVGGLTLLVGTQLLRRSKRR